MCAAWQSMGLWAIVGLTVVVCAPVFGGAGWVLHSVRQWHRRTMIDVKKLGPVFRMAGVGMVGLVVAGFVFYGWVVM